MHACMHTCIQKIKLNQCTFLKVSPILVTWPGEEQHVWSQASWISVQALACVNFLDRLLKLLHAPTRLHL